MNQPVSINHIFRRSFSRYLTVGPEGFRFPDDTIRNELEVRIEQHHLARTLYKDRRPVCRSLDASKPLKDHIAKLCKACPQQGAWTIQVCLELSIDGVPYDLMLAYTSLHNFLLFPLKLNQPIQKYLVRLFVLNRGKWGEVRFALKDQ